MIARDRRLLFNWLIMKGGYDMRLTAHSIRIDYPVKKACFWQGCRVDLRMFIAQPQRAAPAPGHGPCKAIPTVSAEYARIHFRQDQRWCAVATSLGLVLS